MNYSKKSIYTKELATGDKYEVFLYEYKSEKEGPTVHIQSSVHGAELQGNLVILELMDYFEKNDFAGTIRFIPLANPSATNQKIGTSTLGRFNPVTGENWNRNYLDIAKEFDKNESFDFDNFIDENKNETNSEVISSFKKFLKEGVQKFRKNLSVYGLSENVKLHYILQEFAAEADIVLDLHTGPKAVRYLYIPDYAKESAKAFNFPFNLVIPHVFGGAMDEATFMPWVRLEEKTGVRHFESFTVELGGEEQVSSEDSKDDALRILNYLKNKKVITDSPKAKKVNELWADISNFKTYFAPKGGLVEYNCTPGDFSKKGESLLSIFNFADLSKKKTDLLALKDCYIINHSPACSVNEGMELIQVIEVD